jgi:hypothetical protein
LGGSGIDVSVMVFESLSAAQVRKLVAIGDTGAA